MINYQNGKIYKIVCNKTGLIYIGSTTKRLLCQRLTAHKADYNRYKKRKHHYMTSFKILENNDYNIILLEEFPCESKDQLHARERYYIESIECVNKFIPTRTNKEYREDNKDKIKEYYENNKDKIKEHRKIYVENNKDKISDNKKEYYKNHKEQKNKKIECECGGKYTHQHKSTHIKSKKHQKYLNNINEIKVKFSNNC